MCVPGPGARTGWETQGHYIILRNTFKKPRGWGDAPEGVEHKVKEVMVHAVLHHMLDMLSHLNLSASLRSSGWQTGN